MKLGFFTACLPEEPLEQIADWAAKQGFAALEVAAWPRSAERPFVAEHVNVRGFSAEHAEALNDLFDQRSLTLSSLAYYDNNLHPDQATREAVHAHVRACIDAAALAGIPTVGTFIGRDWTKPVSQNLKEAEPIFRSHVEYAGEKGVKIVIENCAMEGWHPDGYPCNLAYSPELWEWMFSLGLYLNYDPSHLVWMGIDPVAVITPYVDRIAHVQAKDIEIMAEKRNRYGWPGVAINRESDPWSVGWWRYRVPGRGEVPWSRVIDTLAEGNFDGVVSVEHEDPVWGGTPDKIKTGLKISHQALNPLINP